MIDQKEASHRLDALTRAITALRDSADRFELEANALRAIIEAEPKKEPRGLCWISDKRSPSAGCNVDIIIDFKDGYYEGIHGCHWRKAIPLTDSELQEYRGRWE